MDAGGIIAIIVGLSGLAGIVFTGLSWRRSDTSAAVATQSTVLGDMTALLEEQRKAVGELRDERDALRLQVWELGKEVDRLREH